MIPHYHPILQGQPGRVITIQEAPNNEYPYVRVATLQDVEKLSKDLREEDLAEIKAHTGDTPYECLYRGLMLSDIPFVAVDENEDPLVMFGTRCTIESPVRVGAIWLLGSPKMWDYKIKFLRESRLWVESLQKQYDLLYNFVDCRNEVHIKWLQWSGFTIINRHEKFGYEQVPFYEFIRIKTD